MDQSFAVNNSLCCRTCLSHKDLVNIFYGKETDSVRAENLLIVTGLVIKRDDGLPQKLCKQCLKIINLTLKFRLKCQEAQKSLVHQSNIKFQLKNTNETKIKSDNGSFDSKPIHHEVTKIEIEIPVLLDRLDDSTGSKDLTTSPSKKKKSYVMCDECGKPCCNRPQLLEHKRAKHSLEKIYNCSQCDYRATTKESYITHIRKHKGERPFACDHCGAAFRRKATLVEHMILHNPSSKTYKCPLCHEVQKSRKRLSSHIYSRHHRKIYKYSCPVCRRLFNCPGYVRTHLVKYHRVQRPDQPRQIDRCLRTAVPEELPPHTTSSEPDTVQQMEMQPS